MVNVHELGPGTVFTDCEDLIRQNLKYAWFDEIVLMETRGWTQASKKKYLMEKD